MIRMMFEKQNQFFIITIENHIIKYWDKAQGKLWGGALQYLPPDPTINMRIDMSRNKIPQSFKEFFKISADEMQEFQNAKDDNELKELVLRDTKRHGCKLIDMKIE